MKNKRTNKGQKNKIKLPFSELVLMIPVIMGFILPLIVRATTVEVSDVFKNITTGNGLYVVDVFLRGKQIWLYWIMGVVIFILISFLLLEHKVFYLEKWMIAIGIFLLCSLISALFAADIKTAFFGGEDMFQGFIVLLGYIILFYYAYMLFRKKEINKDKIILIFLRGALVLSAIFVIIGVLQMIGNDPFSWLWIQKLCNMPGANIIADKRIYLTLYNSNYAGVMTVMLIPILVTGAVIEKSKIAKTINSIVAIGMLVCLIASGSRTGIVMLAVLVILIGVGITVWSEKYRKIVGCATAIFMVICTVILLTNTDVIVSNNKASKPRRCNLTGMATKQEFLKLSVDNKNVFVSWDDEDIVFKSKKGKIYKTVELREKRRNRILQKIPTAMTTYYGEEGFKPRRMVGKFKGIAYFKSAVSIDGKYIRGYVFYINKTPYFITNEWENKEYYYYNMYGRFVKAFNSKDAFSVNTYRFASNRGYIWSKTIPKLKKNILWGCGMDHFSLEFPNHDYAAKERIGKINTIYNKPHSWYLQTATQSGVISLLALVFMLIYILIKGIKVLKNISNNTGDTINFRIVLIGLGLSVLGYCLMNIFNDQMIVVAPVFWMTLGIFTGITYFIKEDSEYEQ